MLHEISVEDLDLPLDALKGWDSELPCFQGAGGHPAPIPCYVTPFHFDDSRRSDDGGAQWPLLLVEHDG